MRTFNLFVQVAEMALREDAPISMYAVDFGFILPNGKVVKGKPEEELHNTVAKRLGYRGERAEQKAMADGLVRYAVDSDGNASLQFRADKPKTKSAVLKFLRSTPEVYKGVYVDVVNEKGYCFKSVEYEDPDTAIKRIPALGRQN